VSDRFTQAGDLRRDGHTRAGVLAGAAAAGVAACGAAFIAGLPGPAVSQPSGAQDARVLDFLLQVEYLQAGFYGEVEQGGALRGELLEFASVVGEQERAHVEALRRALRGDAREAPSYDFGDATADPQLFLETAVELEELAVSAFNGQATNLTKGKLLAAMEIVSVEARHVGWARDLAKRNPAPQPADRPVTEAQAMATMQRTGFLE
jgi:hypothetical protein